MNIVVKILISTGLFVFGYYLGREVTRTRAIRDDIKERSQQWTEES
jgi:hypothetical protein